MSLYAHCKICGNEIQRYEQCYGLKNGWTVCSDCCAPENGRNYPFDYTELLNMNGQPVKLKMVKSGHEGYGLVKVDGEHVSFVTAKKETDVTESYRKDVVALDVWQNH